MEEYWEGKLDNTFSVPQHSAQHLQGRAEAPISPSLDLSCAPDKSLYDLCFSEGSSPYTSVQKL